MNEIDENLFDQRQTAVHDALVTAALATHEAAIVARDGREAYASLRRDLYGRGRIVDGIHLLRYQCADADGKTICRSAPIDKVVALLVDVDGPEQQIARKAVADRVARALAPELAKVHESLRADTAKRALELARQTAKQNGDRPRPFIVGYSLVGRDPVGAY